MQQTLLHQPHSQPTQRQKWKTNTTKGGEDTMSKNIEQDSMWYEQCHKHHHKLQHEH
jgi:hypothetical protein